MIVLYSIASNHNTIQTKLQSRNYKRIHTLKQLQTDSPSTHTKMPNKNIMNKSYDAEWERKIEDFYTNNPYFKHREWMNDVNKKDHDRELKEGFSKPEDWYYSEKYGWFRKGMIKAIVEIAKIGWN